VLREGWFVADLCYYYGDRGYNFGPERYEMAGLGLPAGYDFDTVNSDVIVNSMSVRDGRLVLPDGMGYAMLVMADRPEIAPEVLEKIEQLVRDGAAVCGPKPRHAAGLTNYPACDERVRDIAERVWAIATACGFSNMAMARARSTGALRPATYCAAAALARTFQFNYREDKLHAPPQRRARDLLLAQLAGAGGGGGVYVPRGRPGRRALGRCRGRRSAAAG
jgi:alpha-L-rhamnosidase